MAKKIYTIIDENDKDYSLIDNKTLKNIVIPKKDIDKFLKENKAILQHNKD